MVWWHQVVKDENDVVRGCRVDTFSRLRQYVAEVDEVDRKIGQAAQVDRLSCLG